MTPRPLFRHRALRDLWWTVTNPGLVDSGYCPVVPRLDPDRLRDSFTALEADPEPLDQAVAASLGTERLRLGTYFEDLVRFYVEGIAGHQDLATGVVVSEDKRTVGELDLLFRDGASSQHWELAVKFFLHVPGLAPDPEHCFVGPQTRDRLHRKLARVRDHQLQLAGHPAAAAQLAPWQPLKSSAFVRGRLFYPVPSDWRAGIEATSLDPDHPRGWWCSVDQCDELLPPAHSYALLSRRDWFAPVDASCDELDERDRDGVCAWARDAASEWPSAVARSYVVAGLGTGGEELHRGFLVSVGWPGRGVYG